MEPARASNEVIAKSIHRFLHKPLAESQAIAVAAMQNHRAIGARLRSRRSADVDCIAMALRALPAAGTVVLGMPFCGAGLRLLQALSRSGDVSLQVLSTKVTSRHFQQLRDCYGPLELVDARTMARQPAASAERRIYVTFPDHTVGPTGTNVLATMFGEPFLFQAIEPLLVRKHEATLCRYDGQRLECRVPDAAVDPHVPPEIQLVAELTWLAEAVERALTMAPADYFAWDLLPSMTSRNVRVLQMLQLEMLKSYLRSWMQAGVGNPAPINDCLRLINAEGGLVATRVAEPVIRVSSGSQA